MPPAERTMELASGLHALGRDPGVKHRGLEAHVLPDLHERETSLSHEPTYEPLGYAQPLGRASAVDKRAVVRHTVRLRRGRSSEELGP